MIYHAGYDGFEKKLDAFMRIRGLNDAQLSALLNSQTYINKIRKRRQIPGTRKLRQIADIFGITINDLVPDFRAAGIPDSLHLRPQASPLKKERETPPVITPVQFRDVFVPLVRSIGGNSAADRIANTDHTRIAEELMEAMSDSDGDMVTNLTLYLLAAATAASSFDPGHLDYDIANWKKAARKAAELLLILGSMAEKNQ